MHIKGQLLKLYFGRNIDVILNVNFSGSGSANTVARSDHDHAGVYASSAHTHSASNSDFQVEGQRRIWAWTYAEEVVEVDPNLVTNNKNGEVVGVKYEQLTAILIKAIQELKAENEMLKQQISSLENN